MPMSILIPNEKVIPLFSEKPFEGVSIVILFNFLHFRLVFNLDILVSSVILQ